jgi:hypothetical protein
MLAYGAACIAAAILASRSGVVSAETPAQLNGDEDGVSMLDMSGRVPRHPRRSGRLILALAVTAAGLAACGDGDTPASETHMAGSATSAGAAPVRQKILIKTDAELVGNVDTGRVLTGSTLGDAPFCPGGTWTGGHGNLDDNWLDKNIKCPDGTLRIGFDPRTSKGRTDSGPWKVISGTGAFEAMRGSGQMKMKFGPGEQPTEGHETFTGTVVR